MLAATSYSNHRYYPEGNKNNNGKVIQSRLLHYQFLGFKKLLLQEAGESCTILVQIDLVKICLWIMMF